MIRKKRNPQRTAYSVVDGDTIKVKRKIKGANYIRIVGIDTPEKGQRNYQKAKNQLKGLLGGRKITIETKARNQGRVIGEVKVGNKKISKAMQKRGY